MWGFKSEWKMVVNSPDLITYEFLEKELEIRIEARKNDKETWDVFRTYIEKSSSFNHTEEYRTQSREEAEKIIASLQKDKLPTKKELYSLKLQKAKKAVIKVKRLFKDYNVERWSFAVNDEHYENHLYVRDGDVIEVSIVLHEKNRAIEGDVLHELHATLGLEDADFDIKEELYYYATNSDRYVKSKKYGLFLGKVEMGFDMEK